MTEQQPETPIPVGPNTLRKNRLQLIAIVVIAALSLSGSYLLFFKARDGAVWGTTNKGDWVDPPIRVSDLGLLNAADQQPVQLEALWGIWVVAANGCEAVCSEAVHEMRQLHVLLNKDADRVRRALIATDVSTARLTEPYPKLARWNQAGATPLAPGIYLVDPLGNLVLRYAIDSVGKPVLSDLKRLLKVSQIG